jgi:hypothetical protein
LHLCRCGFGAIPASIAGVNVSAAASVPDLMGLALATPASLAVAILFAPSPPAETFRSFQAFYDGMLPVEDEPTADTAREHKDKEPSKTAIGLAVPAAPVEILPPPLIFSLPQPPVSTPEKANKPEPAAAQTVALSPAASLPPGTAAQPSLPLQNGKGQVEKAQIPSAPLEPAPPRLSMPQLAEPGGPPPANLMLAFAARLALKPAQEPAPTSLPGRAAAPQETAKAMVSTQLPAAPPSPAAVPAAGAPAESARPDELTPPVTERASSAAAQARPKPFTPGPSGATARLSFSAAAPVRAEGPTPTQNGAPHEEGNHSDQRSGPAIEPPAARPEQASPAPRSDDAVEPAKGPRVEQAAAVELPPATPAAQAAPSAPAPRPAQPAGPPQRGEAEAARPAAPARVISLRVSDAGQERVELHVTERAGEVHVAVRTADVNLASSLRENLSDLVQRLEHTGFHAETWRPGPGASASAQDSSADRGGDADQFPGARQQHSQQQGAAGGREQRQQQQPERALWIEEIENSFQPAAERNPWLHP